MQDKDILYELLSLEKNLSQRYNKIAMNCVDKKIRSELCNILEDQNNVVFGISDEIKKRSNKKEKMSDNKSLQATKQKYTEKLLQI